MLKKFMQLMLVQINLHEKLKKNNKVISLEKTNARYLNKELFNELIEIMVCDVSFISLKKVIIPNLNLLA